MQYMGPVKSMNSRNKSVLGHPVPAEESSFPPVNDGEQINQVQKLKKYNVKHTNGCL